MAVATSHPAIAVTEPATVQVQRRRFSVDEYQRMGEVGILTADDRVELIRGEVIAMSPIGGRHLTSVSLVDDVLHAQLPKDVMILSQSPVRMPDDSEPEPDFALVRRAFYDPDPPSARDNFLVIEVADSSRDYDRNVKLPLYAAAGIPEAWLFDLIADRIEQHTEPGLDGYQRIALAGRGKSLTSTVLSALTLSIDAVLSEATDA